MGVVSAFHRKKYSTWVVLAASESQDCRYSKTSHPDLLSRLCSLCHEVDVYMQGTVDSVEDIEED
jgi:hypothetical protein